LKSALLGQKVFSWITGETVEKVPKQILGGDVEKNDFTECATINDPTITKDREAPKNQALIILKGFSTVSVEVKHESLEETHILYAPSNAVIEFNRNLSVKGSF